MDHLARTNLKSDDDVVILPTPWAPPSAALGVGKVAHANQKNIELKDGRIFDFSLGIGLNTTGYIARITPEHLKVLKMLLSNTACDQLHKAS